MSKVYLIIPGLGNSDECHWQSLWAKKGGEFERVEQREWVAPVCTDWVETIEAHVTELTGKEVVLVAHSLGCLAVAHWASKTKLQISGALLVAPPDMERVRTNHSAKGFEALPLDKLPFKSLLVASANDEYANISKAWSYAQYWGSEFVNVGNKGHINSNSNLGEWLEGQQLLQNF